jgi:hypothetical protein
MDHYSRLIGLVFVVAWTIFRLVRYLRAGASKRPSPAVPGAAAMIAQAPAAPPPVATPASPIEPLAAGSGVLAALVAVLVLLVGNAVVWACLFLLPPLAAVPVMLRLVSGVFANLYLLYLARGAAARVRRQSDRGPPAGGNPIS